MTKCNTFEIQPNPTKHTLLAYHKSFATNLANPTRCTPPTPHGAIVKDQLFKRLHQEHLHISFKMANMVFTYNTCIPPTTTQSFHQRKTTCLTRKPVFPHWVFDKLILLSNRSTYYQQALNHPHPCEHGLGFGVQTMHVGEMI